jgi:hypothetical protein
MKWSQSKKEKDGFDSGDWHFSAKTAPTCVGARIYLHAKQSEPAWHGGVIIGWKTMSLPGENHKCMFTYELKGDYHIICPVKWARWKAIVRLDE